MRLNKNEMITLALQPAHKFDKEGVLIIWEKQEGFFKRAESMLCCLWCEYSFVFLELLCIFKQHIF